MADLSIGEVAQQCGVRASAIRYYEEIGLLRAPRRQSGQRRYQPEVIRQLELIQFAKDAGFNLAEIKTLLYGFDAETRPSTRWRALARKKVPEIERLIQQAEAMKRLLEEGLHCDCLRFDECIIDPDQGCVGREH